VTAENESEFIENIRRRINQFWNLKGFENVLEIEMMVFHLARIVSNLCKNYRTNLQYGASETPQIKECKKKIINYPELAVELSTTCERRGIKSNNSDFFIGDSIVDMLISVDDYEFIGDVLHLFLLLSDTLTSSALTINECKKLSFWAQSHFPCYDEPYRNYVYLMVPHPNFEIEKERLPIVPDDRKNWASD
jgi:hypothetical protein